MPRYPTGAFKDPRVPDDQLRTYKPRAAKRERKVDWSPFNPKLPNQINLPVCVGEMGIVSMCNDLARMGVIPAGLPIYFSPLHLWNMARKMRGRLAANEGCYPSDAVDAICQSGLIPYTAMPCRYTRANQIVFDPTDPDNYQAQLIQFPGAVSSRIVDGVEGILNALADGVVMFALPWPGDLWGSSYKEGPLPPIDKLDSIDERHAVMIDSADEDEGMFYGPNWWGEWGIKETALYERPTRSGWKMPFEYIEVIKKKFFGYDAHDVDMLNMAPLPEMRLTLTVNGQKGAYGSGTYKPGERVEVYAGDVPGYNFNCWYPGIFTENKWAPKTTVLMDNVIDLHTVHVKQKESKRCDLFKLAQSLNKAQGI